MLKTLKNYTFRNPKSVQSQVEKIRLKPITLSFAHHGSVISFDDFWWSFKKNSDRTRWYLIIGKGCKSI
jgi:hypothetical protein